MSRGNVLFCLTGSIACCKACGVVSRLTQEGFEVQTVATSAALRFVGEATLEGLSGRRVFTDLWEPGRALDHIEVARRADLALVCPATANAINGFAAGRADDLLGTLFLAWEFPGKPWWIVPSMNARMWSHPATQGAVGRLRSWSVRILNPADGPHACGETGPGRLAEPEAIVAEVLAHFGAGGTSPGVKA